MARTVAPKSNFTAGILGPALAERDDIEDYYNGARDLLNVDPTPQGGFQLRPGLAYYGRLRNVLEGVDLAGATVTFGAQTTGGGTGSSPPPPPADPPPYPDLPPWYDYEHYFDADLLPP